MSEVRVNNLSNENNTGGPTISGITTYSGRHFFVPPQGDTASRPSDCEPGSFRFNTDNAKLEYFRGDTIGWTEIEASSPELGGGTSSSNQNALGARAIAGGGFLGVRTIEFVTVSTLGDSQDFGDLIAAGAIHGKQAVSTETRMLYSGGYINNAIEFITVASTGDSTDFGDMSFRRYAHTGVNDTIRGILGGGASTTPFVPSHGAETNMIEYVTIAQQGNAVDFGDMVSATRGAASYQSSVRGVFHAGRDPSGILNTIQYVTIATTGDAQDFGDATDQKDFNAGGSNATRGIVFGGRDPNATNLIEFTTIATRGRAIDFGDLIQATDELGAAAAGTRAFSLGGTPTPAINIISFVEIVTRGNATDFGDLTKARFHCAGLSNGHGGL